MIYYLIVNFDFITFHFFHINSLFSFFKTFNQCCENIVNLFISTKVGCNIIVTGRQGQPVTLFINTRPVCSIIYKYEDRLYQFYILKILKRKYKNFLMISGNSICPMPWCKHSWKKTSQIRGNVPKNDVLLYSSKNLIRKKIY